MNESISAFLKKRLDEYAFRPVTYKKGTVARSADGVVTVTGLPERRYGELLEFEGGVFGMALDLSEESVGAALSRIQAARRNFQSLNSGGPVPKQDGQSKGSE